MPLAKPDEIASDPFKSAKWDELTQGRSFAAPDAPTLSILCQWHKIAHTAMSELDEMGGSTMYQNDNGDLRAFPQIQTLKTASAEIRQLNRQLGINDEARPEAGHGGSNVLSIVSGKRAERRAGAAV